MHDNITIVYTEHDSEKKNFTRKNVSGRALEIFKSLAEMPE